MKRIALGVLLVFVCLAKARATEFSWEGISRENLGIKAVLVDPGNARVIYFGSNKGVFSSADGGSNWRNVLLIHGQNRVVNFLAFDYLEKKAMYAATGNGLFMSLNQGRWQRIFKGKNYSENDCTVVTGVSPKIYLGTKGGLFSSQDSGRSWHKASGQLANAYILAIALCANNQNLVYAAAQEGVFKSKDSGASWERIFTATGTEKDDFGEESSDDQDEETSSADIRYIALDSHNNTLYLATATGVHKSMDQGASWEALPSYGLLNRQVNYLFISNDSLLYALTKSGVFKYKEERWYECSLGLSGGNFYSLSADKQGSLYLASDKGLFKAQAASIDYKEPRVYSKDEPGIKEVQNAAIHYAEVEPEKIRRWRKLAAKKAIFPKVSANVSRDTGDLWHWESGSSTKANDDVLVRGKETLGWYVTLSWDLSEVIWNSEQTSIDVRSKLMVQLRDDILDEVTKLYFERLRVKMELDNLGIDERKKRGEKELRLEELAASIDALTGGYFSKHLKTPVS